MTTEFDKSRVLVVDDEPSVANALRHVLLMQGYHVRTAAAGRNALASFHEWRPRLVITDLRMAPMNGIELCRQIRAASNVPIIVLSGEDDEGPKVEALDSGADDYVVKPFSPRELVSRVRAVFRRRAPQKSGEAIEYGSLRIDPARHEVAVGERPVKMGLAEFKLLRFLAGHPERVFSRSQLLDNVWGDHVFIEERTVDVHVLRLRKALMQAEAQDLVQTVRGLGYRLSARPDR